MGYSSVALVEQILANALTRGTSSSMPVEIINVGNQVRDTVRTENIIQYVRWADEEIDAALSVIYKVPLRRMVKGEFDILANVAIGDVSLIIDDTSRFLIGDMVLVTDGTTSEKKIISTITDETTMTFTLAFTDSFLAANSLVQRIGYPDPIPFISARFAAANLYDKHFASQASPNVSDYGKALRTMAENDLNSVLNGRVHLLSQKRLGRRFFNPALLDVNAVGAGEKNREKPNA